MEDIQDLRTKLNLETARFPWRDLLVYFASGWVIQVHPSIDLIDVAVVLANDDKAQVQGWMNAGTVEKVSDAQAQAWLENDVELWTVVVKP